ncbi:MAG: hypothetical protein Q9187_004539, partial [Circinaria calcarea]
MTKALSQKAYNAAKGMYDVDYSDEDFHLTEDSNVQCAVRLVLEDLALQLHQLGDRQKHLLQALGDARTESIECRSAIRLYQRDHLRICEQGLEKDWMVGTVYGDKLKAAFEALNEIKKEPTALLDKKTRLTNLE